MANSSRHGWRKEVVREISVTLILVCELYPVADESFFPSIRYIFWLSVTPMLRLWLVLGNACVSKNDPVQIFLYVTRLQAV